MTCRLMFNRLRVESSPAEAQSLANTVVEFDSVCSSAETYLRLCRREKIGLGKTYSLSRCAQETPNVLLSEYPGTITPDGELAVSRQS